MEAEHMGKRERLRALVRRGLNKVKVRRLKSPRSAEPASASDEDETHPKLRRLEKAVHRQLSHGRAAKRKLKELKAKLSSSKPKKGPAATITLTAAAKARKSVKKSIRSSDRISSGGYASDTAADVRRSVGTRPTSPSQDESGALLPGTPPSLRSSFDGEGGATSTDLLGAQKKKRRMSMDLCRASSLMARLQGESDEEEAEASEESDMLEDDDEEASSSGSESNSSSSEVEWIVDLEETSKHHATEMCWALLTYTTALCTCALVCVQTSLAPPRGRVGLLETAAIVCSILSVVAHFEAIIRAARRGVASALKILGGKKHPRVLRSSMMISSSQQLDQEPASPTKGVRGAKKRGSHSQQQRRLRPRGGDSGEGPPSSTQRGGLGLGLRPKVAFGDEDEDEDEGGAGGEAEGGELSTPVRQTLLRRSTKFQSSRASCWSIPRVELEDSGPGDSWSNIPASKFSVRGPTYLTDGKKIASAAAAYECVAVHVFQSKSGEMPGLLDARPDLIPGEDPAAAPRLAVPEVLAFNITAPAEAPSITGWRSGFPCWIIVIVLRLSAETRALLERHAKDPAFELPPSLRLLKEWIETAADVPSMNSRLKGIFVCHGGYVDAPRTMETRPADMPRIMQKWNGKPVLMAATARGFGSRPGIAKLLPGPGVVEIAVNVGESFSYVGRGAVYIMIAKLAQVDCDVSFTLEGRTQDELPEAVIGATTFSKIRLHEHFKV